MHDPLKNSTRHRDWPTTTKWPISWFAFKMFP